LALSPKNKASLGRTATPMTMSEAFAPSASSRMTVGQSFDRLLLMRAG
jgi:hypothetical protein